VKAFFVSNRLAFGSAIKTKTHVKQLRALGITHVINLRRSNNKKVQKFSHLWLPFKDDMKPRPRWFYKCTLKFYRKAMRHREAKLFVMCHHGICRSASLAYFFLRGLGKSRNKAERTIKTARPTARVVLAYRESGERYLDRINHRQSFRGSRVRSRRRY
jgi:protein-tyrosine phosphatase